MSKLLPGLVWGLLIVVVSASFSTFAIENTAENPIESITTTASRTPVSVTDTGSAVTILDRQFITQSNATSVADLLRSVPGLHISQQGARGALTQIRIRGGEANQVLVLIDGVEANDSAQGGEFNFAHLMTSQIERIEIVRGPQSALWGSDALSGVINIITLADRFEGDKLDLVIEAGSFNSNKTGLTWRRAGDRIRVQLVLSRFETQGSNISRQGGEEDGYENTTVGLNGSFEMSETLTAFGMVRYSNSRNEYDDIDFITTGLPVDADNDTRSRQLYAKFGAKLSSSEGRYKQRISFMRTDTDNENDSGSVVNDITRSVKDLIQYQGDIFLGNQTLSFIAEYEDLSYEQRGLSSAFGNPNRDLHSRNRSIALEYRNDLEYWNFSASARHDENSDFDDANSFRLTSTWHTPVSDLDFYVSVGRSFKNPTFTERFGFFDNFVGNPDLKPEISNSWEFGLRSVAWQGKLRSSVTVFQSRLEDEVNGFVFDPGTGSFTADNRKGDSDRQGLELEITWLATAQLDFRVGYTYVDSTFDDTTGRGVDEVRRPRHVGSLIGNYHWGKANLNLSIIRSGNQQDDFFPPFPPFQERVELDAYTLINLAGSYQLTDNFQLTGRIENLSDEEYEEVLGFQSPGFAAYAGIRLSW